MPRLSIDITDEQHRRLKASAALEGRSIKDYVLERALGDAGEGDALGELAALLRPRIEAADRGDMSSRSVADIATRARAKRKA